MVLYFVRHGESEANVNDVFGNSETPLTELGVRQSVLLAERIAKLPIDLILASDYLRTRQTCKFISEIIKKEPQYLPLLREFKRPSELSDSKFGTEDINLYFKQLSQHADDPAWHYSDEENFIEFRSRAQKFVDYISEIDEENVLLVTHGAITRMIILTMMLRHNVSYELFDNFWFFRTTNTGLTIVKGKKNDWSLLTWNDFAHLAE